MEPVWSCDLLLVLSFFRLYTYSLAQSLVCSFVRSFVGSVRLSDGLSVSRSFLSSFVRSFVRSFRSLVRWFGPSFGRSDVRSFLCSVVSFILCIWLLTSLLNIVVVMMASIQVKICFFFSFLYFMSEVIIPISCKWYTLHFFFFSIRVGFAQALGFLPKFMLSSRLKVVSTISFSSTTNHTGWKVLASKRNKRVIVYDSLRRLIVALFHRFQCFILYVVSMFCFELVSKSCWILFLQFNKTWFSWTESV